MQDKKDKKKNTEAKLAIKKPKSKPINVFWLVLILFISTILVYHKAFQFAFVAFDDNAKVYENPLITTLSLTQIRLFFSSFVFHTYMPLTLLSYAIDYSIWQLNPSGYHAINILIHLINVLLLFVFIRNFTKNQTIAFFASLIFAVHPLNVETVAWVSERNNLLYATFFILSLYFYSKFTNTNKNKNYIFALICFLLSLFSKPGAVIIPVAFVLMDSYKQNSFDVKKIIRLSIFFIVSLAFGLLAIYATKTTGNISEIVNNFNWFDRFAMAVYSFDLYLFKFFFPVNLSAFYPFPTKSGAFLPTIYYLSFIIPLFLVAFVIKAKQLKKDIIFSLLFFIANISIVLMVVPVGGNFMIAEHFVYVPYIGLCLIAGIWIEKVLKHELTYASKLKSFIIPVFLIVIIVFSIVSFNRTKVWKNSAFLFKDMIDKQPEQALGYYGLGIFNYMQGDLNSALANQSDAIKVDSTYSEAYHQRGIIYKELNNLDLALIDLNKTLTLSPKNYKALCNRGNIYLNYGDTLNALDDYNKSIALNNSYSDAYYNRGRIKSDMKDYSAAIEDFTKTIELNKFDGNAYNNRAIAKYFLKKYNESIIDYNEAIKIDDKNGLYFKNRGLSYLALSDSTKACDDFYQAYALGYKGASAQLKKYCK